MSVYQQARYKPVIVPTAGTVNFTGNGIGGFLCITAGTITINRLVSADDAQGPTQPAGTYQPVIVAFPVTAGQYVTLPFFIATAGGQIVAGAGCSGVLAVA